MAKKELTEEQENEIKTLLANNEMLEKTKKEAEQKGNKVSVKQIERAQQEVIDHINSIDSTVLGGRKTSLVSNNKKTIEQVNLFDTDMSIFDILEEHKDFDEKESKLQVVEKQNNDVTELDDIDFEMF